MTEPRDMHDDRQTDATADYREPEVKPELIQDLDVTGDDVVDVMGGCRLSTGNCGATQLA
jgi:hypothetical protein